MDTRTSEETWQFRPLLVSDADSVSIIDLALFDNGFGTRQVVAELTAGSGYGVWIRGQLAGYCLTRHDHELVEITRLAVLPEFQGQGVGGALLEMAQNDAGRSTFTLHARKSNLRAVNLYLYRGFEIVGEDEDSWVMQRPSSIPPSPEDVPTVPNLMLPVK